MAHKDTLCKSWQDENGNTTRRQYNVLWNSHLSHNKHALYHTVFFLGYCQWHMALHYAHCNHHCRHRNLVSHLTSHQDSSIKKPFKNVTPTILRYPGNLKYRSKVGYYEAKKVTACIDIQKEIWHWKTKHWKWNIFIKNRNSYIAELRNFHFMMHVYFLIRQAFTFLICKK